MQRFAHLRSATGQVTTWPAPSSEFPTGRSGKYCQGQAGRQLRPSAEVAGGTTRNLYHAAFELTVSLRPVRPSSRPLRFRFWGGPGGVKPRTAKVAKKSRKVRKKGSVNSLARRQDV